MAVLHRFAGKWRLFYARLSFYQLNRPVNCNVRGELPDDCTLSMPLSEPTLFGFPGWFSTLKKSTWTRRRRRSVIGTVLNAEASRPHWSTLGKYCCRNGARPAQLVRVTVPFASGTQTVLELQNDETLVPAGALGGFAVLP